MAGKWDGEFEPVGLKDAPVGVEELEADADNTPLPDLGDMVREGIPKLLMAALRQAERGGEVKEIVPVLGMALKLAEAKETSKGMEWKVTVEWIDGSHGD
jgi:hypothetical protein